MQTVDVQLARQDSIEPFDAARHIGLVALLAIFRAQQGNGSLADSYGWNELNGQGYEHFSRLPALMDALTAEDLRRVAHTYFAQPTAHIVTVMPEAKPAEEVQ